MKWEPKDMLRYLYEMGNEGLICNRSPVRLGIDCKKITYVIDSKQVGGCEIYVKRLAQEAVNNNFQVYLICPKEICRTSLVKSLKEAGVKIKCISFSGYLDFPNLLSFLFYLIKNKGIYHFNLCCLYSCSVMLKIAGIFKRNIIVTMHSLDSEQVLNMNQNYKERLQKVNKFIVLSQAMYSDYKRVGLSEEVMVLIRNGVYPEKYNKANLHNYAFLRQNHESKPTPEINLKEDDIVFIVLGRLELQKNLSFLFKAIKSTSTEEKNELKLIIAGQGSVRKKLENEIKELNLNDRVYFLGERDDVPDLLSIADIFVSVSESEASPLSILEAMAAGKPCIVTDVPGNNEIIRHNVNGLLVELNNIPELVKAIEGMCSMTKDELEEIGLRNKREVLKEYNLHEKLKVIFQIYKKT